MLVASAAAATMLMLSGCSAAAPGESEPPAKASATSEETAAKEVLGDDPGNPDPLPELTPAGSTVGIGESIIVRENDSDGWAILKITVTSIEEGDASFLASPSEADSGLPVRAAPLLWRPQVPRSSGPSTIQAPRNSRTRTIPTFRIR